MTMHPLFSLTLLLAALCLAAMTTPVGAVMTVNTKLDVTGRTLYYGALPVQVHSDGPNNDLWLARRYASFTAERASTVTFRFGTFGAHDVWMLPSASAYARCDFTQATLLPPTPTRGDGMDPNRANTVVWTADKPGVYFFACKRYCKISTQKLTITVVGGTPNKPSCRDGVMNGDEAGVDCGSDLCGVACATCDDNVQNADETGIDCGGSCGRDCVPMCGVVMTARIKKCGSRATKDACDQTTDRFGLNQDCSWCGGAVDQDEDRCTVNTVCRLPRDDFAATGRADVYNPADTCIGSSGTDSYIRGSDYLSRGLRPYSHGVFEWAASATPVESLPAALSVQLQLPTTHTYLKDSTFACRTIPGNQFRVHGTADTFPKTIRTLNVDIVAAGGYTFKCWVATGMNALALPPAFDPTASPSCYSRNAAGTTGTALCAEQNLTVKRRLPVSCAGSSCTVTDCCVMPTCLSITCAAPTVNNGHILRPVRVVPPPPADPPDNSPVIKYFLTDLFTRLLLLPPALLSKVPPWCDVQQGCTVDACCVAAATCATFDGCTTAAAPLHGDRTCVGAVCTITECCGEGTGKQPGGTGKEHKDPHDGKGHGGGGDSLSSPNAVVIVVIVVAVVAVAAGGAYYVRRNKNRTESSMYMLNEA